MKTLLALLLSSLALHAAAQEFDNLQFMGDTCNIAQTGYAGTSETIFKGEEPWNATCSTPVPLTEFNKRYSSCSLSGMTQAGQSGRGMSCSFGYYDKAKTKVYFGRYLATSCFYTCIKAK